MVFKSKILPCIFLDTVVFFRQSFDLLAGAKGACDNLRMSIFILSLVFPLFSLSSEPSWKEGLRELQVAAKNHPKEIGRFYFYSKFPNGKIVEKWGVKVEGTETSLLPDFSQAGMLLKSIADKKPSSFIGCFLHTHPRKIYLALQKKTKSELQDSKLVGLEKLENSGVVSAPPGMADISLELGIEEEFEEYGLNIPVRKSLGALDSLGIWYYQYFKDDSERNGFLRKLNFSSSDIKKYQSKKPDLNEVRVPFMIYVSKSGIDAATITASPQYRDLLFAYAMEDVELKFMPFGKESNQAPCGFKP